MVFWAWVSIGVCLAALTATVLIVRSSKTSLGLPFAYMVSLLLIHVPGAFAYAVSDGKYAGLLAGGDYVAQGIALTAIGSVCFVVGLLLARRATRRLRRNITDFSALRVEPRLLLFCVIAGWLLTFGATPLRGIPTLSAIVYFGGAIWMLGVMLGLARAVQRRHLKSVLAWIGALMVYPLYTLVFSGFLSYGSTTVIVVLSLTLVALRRASSTILAVILGGYLGISVFVNYFESRDALRSVIWSNASTGARIEAVVEAFSNFKLFDPKNPEHLKALAARLNQNEFVGLARARILAGDVDFLEGKSFLQGLIAPIPRALWPSKPVYGGSAGVVRRMTGLNLSRTTSWGVGNVMEFYINFGMPSLVVCFIMLGWLIGWLDFRAYRELVLHHEGNVFRYFLPCAALIQPNGSMVEIVGGSVSALVAAYGWRYLWNWLSVLRRSSVANQLGGTVRSFR